MRENIFIFVSVVLTVSLHQLRDRGHGNNFVTNIIHIHKPKHGGKYLSVLFLI